MMLTRLPSGCARWVMMELLQLSYGRWNRPTVTRYEVQFWHSPLPSRTTIDHRRLGRTSSSGKVAIVQEDITEGTPIFRWLKWITSSHSGIDTADWGTSP